ncbi:hypothetical protein BC826DRAFT_65062 [Russula brevipes]|nr:hypothetical protein BC826DRAFT_65062 [Russula brevipes]
MSSSRSHPRVKQNTDGRSHSSSRTSTNEAQYHIWSRQSIQSYRGSISNCSDHTNVSADDEDSLRLSRDNPRVSRNFSVSASSGRGSSVSDHKSILSLWKSTFHRNESQSTIRTSLGARPDTLPTAPSTPLQEFSPLSAPSILYYLKTYVFCIYEVVIPLLRKQSCFNSRSSQQRVSLVPIFPIVVYLPSGHDHRRRMQCL